MNQWINNHSNLDLPTGMLIMVSYMEQGSMRMMDKFRLMVLKLFTAYNVKKGDRISSMHLIEVVLFSP